MPDYNDDSSGTPTTNLFGCWNNDHRSLLMLTTWSGGRRSGRVTRFGDTCDVCTGMTAETLSRVIEYAPQLGNATAVAQPEPVPSRMETSPPASDGAERVVFFRDLIGDGPAAAISNTVASQAADWARRGMDGVPATEGSAVVSAIAKGIDSIDSTVSRGVAWIVTGITGMPEFPANVLGSLFTSAFLPSFKIVAKGLRVFGTICSGIAGSLDRCACLRDLAATELIEQPIAEISRDVLSVSIGPDEPPEPLDESSGPEEPPPPPPPPPLPGGGRFGL